MEKKKITLIILLLLNTAFAQENIYWKLKVYTNNNGLIKLQQLGINLDHGLRKQGVFLIHDFSTDEKILLDQNEIKYDILIEDITGHYIKNRHLISKKPFSCESQVPNYEIPAHFNLGSMGGYFTYEEIWEHIDQMNNLYPQLISIKSPLSENLTHDGHPIYWVEITNSNYQEAINKPQVLYTALHHAREPGSVSQLIFYMYYLLENYGNNEQITTLVNQSRLFFIPVVNPDGYLYNQISHPSGGGMWRKNRRQNEDQSIGVDLNRNYSFHWGEDNLGSSPTPASEIYRGTEASSEPEIQMIENFCLEKDIQLAMNYHAYGNLLIYPWGYIAPSNTPDSLSFIWAGKELTQQNNYLFGTPIETVGYSANGDANDWMYGEQLEKNKILSITPEVGTSFWENTDLIIPTCKESLFTNIAFASMVFPYVETTSNLSPTYSFIPDSIIVYFKNISLNPGNFNISLETESAAINILTESSETTWLNHLEQDSLVFYFDIAENNPLSGVVNLKIHSHNGMYSKTKDISFIYGENYTAFIEEGNSMDLWFSDDWGVDFINFFSPNGSITDSPSGNYNSNETTTIELFEPVSLLGQNGASLKFFAKWDIEFGWDYAQLNISTDNGFTWTPLCGKYTKEGNQYQDFGQPIYDGTQNDWVEEYIDISAYDNQEIKLQFRLVSDGATQGDGFYFDNLRISSNHSLGLTESKNYLKLHPNPSKGELKLNFSRNSSGLLKIFSIQGKEIYQTMVKNKKYIQIDSSLIPNGAYIIKFKNMKEIWIKNE